MYPEKIVGAILELRHQGKSIRQIVRTLQRSQKFRASVGGVKGVIDRESTVITTNISQPETRGRSCLVDEKTRLLWKKKISRNKFLTAKKIFRDPELNKINASYTTVYRVINDMGLLAHKQPTKFWLGGKSGIDNRLDWARIMKKELKKDSTFFDRVIFSDECMLRQQQCGSVYLRGKRGEKFADRYISQKKKFDPDGQVIVWGMIQRNGERNLVLVDHKINANAYIDILDENLLGFEGLEDMIFQQDLAPAYRATKTTEWLNDQDIEVLTWIANSPDINPIENVWAWLKH